MLWVVLEFIFSEIILVKLRKVGREFRETYFSNFVNPQKEDGICLVLLIRGSEILNKTRDVN